jgi:GntR family transcriptional repressor for pyruvate dehydrogenase complex
VNPYNRGRLPAEWVLAARLGVGRPSIREAVKALGVLEVLESRRGDGTYIKSLDSLGREWPEKPELTITRAALIELYEVRKMVEPRAAALAAMRADDRQLAVIEAHLKTQELDTTRVDREADYLFHDAILRAAGNQILSRIVDGIAPLLRESRTLTARTTPDIPLIVNHHRRIFEAIRCGDPELAEHAMREHLYNTALDLIADPKR